MMIKKILFLHGFFASGSCIPAQALRQAFASKAEVLTPDLPLHPKEALAFIEDICQQEKPCVLVGNSNGAFLAQIVASRHGLPALLANLPKYKLTSGTIHTQNSPTAFGDCLGRMTIWHTLNRCSCNIIRMPIIFPVGIHLQRKKCGSIMCRSWKNS